MTANMDETPISADMPSETTVEQLGSKTIPITSTEHEKKATHNSVVSCKSS